MTADNRKTERRRARGGFRRNLLRFIIQLLVWLGVAVLYYFVISLFFDTPLEYRMKHSTDRLKEQYEALSVRYDSLETVLGNLVERDRSVFRTLFESDPYDFDTEADERRLTAYEQLLGKSTRKLTKELAARVERMESGLSALNESYLLLQERIDAAGEAKHSIPAIQPVTNKKLSLLTASYGMRMNPFYKTMQMHQGVDYTVPEGSSVFATADGKVKSVSTRSSTSGRTVVLDHGNGYETSYSHLGKIEVFKNQQVRRGDIIARTGNTGLSLAPHLHYEVWYNGMRIDPIHYFFMELTPENYQRIMQIAESGMQSFD
ncbi:MAG: M23 family metallopeptidase [Alistipes sp.]|nr:M23 family metallopeptidase [Alistipes sp.]